VTTCSALAAQLGDVPAGTASIIRSFLLLEDPGPWGEDARERAFHAALGDNGWDRLQQVWESEGLRPLLVRRPSREARRIEAPSLLVGSVTHRWVERLPADALPSLDFEAVAAGTPGHGEPVDGPVLAVCTNGAVDRCCAVRGRPLAAVLSARWPDHVWETTHVGGCRFAANLLVLPSGALHGALSPERGLAVAEAALRDCVLPGDLRGITSHGWPERLAARAEVALRRRLDLTGLDDVVVVSRDPHPDVVETEDGPEPAGADVVLSAAGTRWRAVARVRALGAHDSVCDGPLDLDTVDVLALHPLPHPC
jgi:hypothetical protein